MPKMRNSSICQFTAMPNFNFHPICVDSPNQAMLILQYTSYCEISKKRHQQRGCSRTLSVADMRKSGSGRMHGTLRRGHKNQNWTLQKHLVHLPQHSSRQRCFHQENSSIGRSLVFLKGPISDFYNASVLRFLHSPTGQVFSPLASSALEHSLRQHQITLCSDGSKTR